jgi:hypothetical protein
MSRISYAVVTFPGVSFLWSESAPPELAPVGMDGAKTEQEERGV